MNLWTAMSSRKKKTSIGVALTLAFALALGVGPVFAIHNDGIFEIDGNVTDSPTVLGDDWKTLYTCPSGGGLGCTTNTPGSGNSAFEIAPFVLDGTGFSVFTGGGSKDQLDITQWNWKDGSEPDKDDLIESFAAVYRPTSGSRAGDKILYFGANRLAVNGDAQIGFWFLQTAVSPKSDGTFQDSLGNPAQHAKGDILILSNFVQGGGTSNIQAYKVTSVNADGSVTLVRFVNNTAGANLVCDTADSACAATNGGVISALDPDFTAKSGATTGNYPIVGFFEGGLDLTDFGLGGECFPTFMVETRSSQSITAVLKDFTIGRFEQCKAAITTEIHSAADNSDLDLQGRSVIPGTTIHDLAIVTGTAGSPVPTGSVTFKRYSTIDCTGTPTASPQIVNLTVGSTDARANSSSIITNPGDLSYEASYSGDGNYPAQLVSLCEPLAVNKCDSAIATHILKVNCTTNCEVTDSFIDLAGAATVAVHDQAIVTSAASCTQTPTGNVTFQIFNNGNCSSTPALAETDTLDGTGKVLSSTVNLGANGLSYRATYNGDSNYNPTSVSRCEPVCAIDTTK